MASNVFQLETWFSGRVQGVGFRYQTVQVAKGYEVAGQVRNLADGRVHLLAQGEEEEVRSFVAAVEDTLSDYIREREDREARVEADHTGFAIAG